jgi:hypothetical protein
MQYEEKVICRSATGKTCTSEIVFKNHILLREKSAAAATAVALLLLAAGIRMR